MSVRPPPPPLPSRIGAGPPGAGNFDTFVSYRRADGAAARAVKRMAETFGARVFLEDEVVAMGGDWAGQIHAAAKGASTMLVLWSRNAAASRWIPVEVSLVDPQRCKIVPVLLDASPLPPFLSRYQGVQGLAPHAGALARLAELTQQRSPRLSHAQAVAQLVDELRADGVDLTPEQAESFVPLVGIFGGGSLAAVLAFLAGHAWARATALLTVGAGLGAATLQVTSNVRLPPTSVIEACGRIDALERTTRALAKSVAVCSAEVGQRRSDNVTCVERVETLAERPTPECRLAKPQLDQFNERVGATIAERDRALSDRLEGIQQQLAKVLRGGNANPQREQP